MTSRLSKSEVIEGASVEQTAARDEGVCARVKLRLEQDAVLTRDGFRATLEVENNDANRLENVRVDMSLRAVSGIGGDDLFEVRFEGAQVLSAVDGSGILAGNSTGTANWLIIPTVDAAPFTPTRFLVGGTLSYELDGQAVTVPLYEAPITVYPSPRLTLKYFHQRDVFADDPFTDRIEPSIPYSLAVMAQNIGYGEAKNFRITSAQPKIIENEKGLLIDFNIIASEVAGQPVSPSLTVNLGNIQPGTATIGRWLLTSSLQGLFIDYSATFEHVDGLGNPRLSLLHEVTIHEMIQVVQAGGIWNDGKPDFLVNDVPDARDLPDTLYQSNGNTNHVEVVAESVLTGTLSASNLQVTLAATLPGDWVYLRVPNPGGDDFRLERVVRSDGVEVSVGTNVWTTDRTFIGLGRRPVQEHILHLLDYNSPGTYTLHYVPGQLQINDNDPPFSEVAPLPELVTEYFQVSWSGRDEGPLGGAVAGIAFYDIFVSENGGHLLPWLSRTPLVSATFIGQANARYAFYSIATDANANREAAPGSPDAETLVGLTNSPPVIAVASFVAIDEGTLLDLPYQITDPDAGQTLTVTLGPGAPPGMLINAVDRRLRWTTGEGHGPSMNLVRLVVRDNAFPSLSATGQVTVVVNEVNAPPALGSITNRTVKEGQLISFIAMATDPDRPPQQLTYALNEDAPKNVTLHPTTGQFTWRPTELQGGTTNAFTITVTDNGPPAASAARSFTVIVRDTQPDFVLHVGSTQLLVGTSSRVPLTLNTGADLTNVHLVLAATGTQLTNLALQALAPEVGGADFVALGSNRFDAQIRSRTDATFQGHLTLAQLAFDTASNGPSGVAVLRGDLLRGSPASSATPLQGSTVSGRVFKIAEEPILDSALTTNRQLALTLYARSGERYVLERNLAFDGLNVWQPDFLVAPTDLKTPLPSRPLDHPEEYFRALIVPDYELTIRIQGNQALLEWSRECVGCVLEESGQVGINAQWGPSAAQPQEVNGRYRVAVTIGPEPRFYRLAIPSR